MTTTTASDIYDYATGQYLASVDLTADQLSAVRSAEQGHEGLLSLATLRRVTGLSDLLPDVAPETTVYVEGEPALTRTAYRVYLAEDGCDAEYCGERDTLAEAIEFASAEPAGLERCLWDTARAAGHVAGLTAPPTDGEEEDEPEGWYGDKGWHCVVEVTYRD